MNEKTFKASVAKELRKHGHWTLINHSIYRSGIPDIATVISGRAVWLELKFHKGSIKETICLNHEVSATQSKTLRDIAQSGGLAGVVIGLEDGTCTFASADELLPGPNKKFVVDAMSIEEMISWIAKSATGGPT